MYLYIVERSFISNDVKFSNFNKSHSSLNVSHYNMNHTLFYSLSIENCLDNEFDFIQGKFYEKK